MTPSPEESRIVACALAYLKMGLQSGEVNASTVEKTFKIQSLTVDQINYLIEVYNAQGRREVAPNFLNS